jgi:hypothetical protein
MRSSGIVRRISSRSGLVSSSDRGGGTSQPPENIDANQCRPVRRTVPASARTTCPTWKSAQARPTIATASARLSARAASPAALMAPADVPTSTRNGQTASGGSHSAIAFSTPTW